MQDIQKIIFIMLMNISEVRIEKINVLAEFTAISLIIIDRSVKLKDQSKNYVKTKLDSSEQNVL